MPCPSSLTQLRQQPKPQINPPQLKAEPPEATVGALHLLLPAHKSTVDLCKAVVGAQTLGFPVASLPNWADDDQQDTESGFAPKGTLPHVRKLYGVLEYLDRLDATANDDLVVIMDAYDNWFQLTPEILVNRYHDINAAAKQRIEAQMGIVASAEDVHQSIIFAAQKECWPGQPNEISCYTMPESPLPLDFYGDMTDKNTGGPNAQIYDTYRAKYLNSGFLIGPVKKVRALYRRAVQTANSIFNRFDSDQFVLTSIFAQQEYMRTANAHAGSNTVPVAWTKIADREVFVPSMQVEYEFGIGLDYWASLSFPTVHSVNDSDFLTFQDATSIQTAFERNSLAPSQLSMPADLTNSRPPNAQGDWSGLPLFTNLRSGVIPATIHHNAWQYGLKQRREWLWDKVWYQPMVRQTVQQAASKVPRSGELFVDKRGKTWTTPRSHAALSGQTGVGAISLLADGNIAWHPWGELCSAEDEREVFRDAEPK